MNAPIAKPTAAASLIKPNPNAPALRATGLGDLIVKAGTVFNGHAFAADTPVPLDAVDGALIPGLDYAIHCTDGVLSIRPADRIPEGETLLGGFHYAPGGNATARAGGDDVPAINPCSLWDVGFRPACIDPRGMTLVDAPGKRFWADIYLTGVNHLTDGTSRFGATIADGADRPIAWGKPVKRFDYATAGEAMAAHGKGLLSLEEFFAAAFGVTEKTAAGDDPETAGIDAPRTSRWGLMQATGNLWVWGHDGDPDEPRAAILGGSWIRGVNAGSRYASVDSWVGYSDGHLGARGRSDHLQPV